MDKILYSVPEAMAALSIGRSFLFELLASGQIRSCRAGKRRLIYSDSLKQWADSLAQDVKPTTN